MRFLYMCFDSEWFQDIRKCKYEIRVQKTIVREERREGKKGKGKKELEMETIREEGGKEEKKR